MEGHTATARLLLDRGAQADAKDKVCPLQTLAADPPRVPHRLPDSSS